MKSVMGGCLHDRLLTVGVFYSQQKQAIDDTLAFLCSDTASTETRERNSVAHHKWSARTLWAITALSVSLQRSCCHYVDQQRILLIENGFNNCSAISIWLVLVVINITNQGQLQCLNYLKCAVKKKKKVEELGCRVCQ